MTVNKLQDNLTYLRLPAIRQHLQTETEKAAQNNLSHLDYLDRLIELETQSRRHKGIERRIAAARFPFVRTLEQYDFGHPSSINKKQLLRLFDLDFVSAHAGAVLLGAPGLGKTHLAVALGYRACQAGISTLFTTAVDMINQLGAALSDHTFLRALRRYTRPQLLIVDEIGFLPIDKQGCDLLFQVVSHRYERGSLVLTTNRAFKDWGDMLNADNTLASAIIDRLMHRGELIVIRGDSYRQKPRQS